MGSQILRPCSFAARAVAPQTPTPQTHRISMGGALKARDPQTFTNSTRPCPTPGLHSAAGAPIHWDTPPSPAQSLLCWPCPQGLHSPARLLLCRYTPPRPSAPEIQVHTSPFCRATTPRLAQPCKISALLGHARKACTALHNIHSQSLCP
jgi:hypothetical protein